MGFQRKQLSAENALIRLETLCARSEHCEWELREKLRGWGIAGVEAVKILDFLHKARYYDDERFARAFARDKLLYNRWGKRKIVMALKTKRVADSAIDMALDDIDENQYIGLLTDLMKAKAKTIKEGNTYEGRTKLYRAALARGFESHLVASVLRADDLWTEIKDL